MANSDKFLQEIGTIASCFAPVDMQTGANTGIWIALDNYEYCLIVLLKAAGTSGDEPILTVRQATDNSGTGAKALNFTRIRTKIGATTVGTVADFTITDAAAGNTYTMPATTAADQAIVCIEIKAADLDAQNSFDHIQMSIADTGSNAQLGTAIYIPFGGRYKQSTPPTAEA